MGISTGKTESIADHMYRMSIMVQLIQDSRINKDKCIKMALVHDMAETITGDITPDDGISAETKNHLETVKLAPNYLIYIFACLERHGTDQIHIGIKSIRSRSNGSLEGICIRLDSRSEFRQRFG